MRARDQKAAREAIEELARAAKEGRNMVEPSIAAAKAGVTTGEWGNVLRGVFGEYRAPTGVSSTARQVGGALDAVRGEVERVSQKLGKRAKFLVGKPGLDGHSNGAEQIAVRARDAGFDVIYAGIRSTPAELVEAAKKEGAHCIGLSILSGSHVTLAHEVIKLMKQEGVDGAARRRRHHSAGRREALARSGRRGGLHAEELRPQRHHDRPRAYHREGGGIEASDGLCLLTQSAVYVQNGSKLF